MSLDHLLRIFATGQLVFATLRSVSLYLKSRSEIESRLEGPCIQPPLSNETSLLWDIVGAFREGVELGIAQENYKSNDWTVLLTSTKKKEPYELSLRSSAPKIPDAVEIPDIEQYTDEQQDNDACKNFEAFFMPSGELLDGDDEHKRRKVLVRAYAAKKFSRLRSLYGISETSYQKSLLETGPYVSFQTNSKGAARTGAIFFWSRDGSFLVKTIKKEEALTLLHMLPKYCSFMESNGRRSLLTRFYGMYDVCFGDECRTFVVMNAVFPASALKHIMKRFDLKGSTVGRVCSSEERMLKGNNAVLKDLDLVVEMNVKNGRLGTHNGFSLGPMRKDTLFQQIERDITFLKDCCVIDYSLLVGIEPCKHWYDRALNTRQKFLHKLIGGSYGDNGGELAAMHGKLEGRPVMYYLGLIDFLQPFNGKKLIEYKLKSLLYKKDTFSCVPPDIYAQRLVSFLDTVIC